MRAEVIEKPGAGPGNFAPSHTNLGAIAVDARLEQHDFTDKVFSNRILDSEEIAVPAPVLKYGEQDVALFRDGREMPCLFDGDREGLVDDHVATGAHHRFCQRRVRIVRTRYYDEVDLGMHRQRFWIRHDVYARQHRYHIRGAA